MSANFAYSACCYLFVFSGACYMGDQIEADGIGWACSTCEEIEIHTGLWQGSLKERDCLE